MRAANLLIKIIIVSENNQVSKDLKGKKLLKTIIMKFA